MNDDITTGGSAAMIPSANGQAYRAYLESAQAVLAGLTMVDYYAAPLPSPADESLAEIISAYTGWPADVRERFRASLPRDKAGLAAIFGHRAATLAVRTGDPDRLRLGLIGNAIANDLIPDGRHVEAALAVFHHCAGKLELEPEALFDEAAQFASDEMAERLRAFGRRTDVTLKQFGWREIRTAEGVRYRYM
ncbi:MAG: hypothetical protein KBF17_08795 [Candidatus Promineofilum sp.]|nr:hypothetical protein [Promineifilum sp.]